MESLVTIFPNSEATAKPYHVSIDKIVDRIKNGQSKDKINKLRLINKKTDLDYYREFKKSLPSICFSGVFTYRDEAHLVKHSGLVAIDFDHLGDRLMAFRSKIKKDKYTFMAFISPGGDGLKVVLKIPANKDTHKSSCRAISEYYKEETLDDFYDTCRICFESYDPDIYYNPDSEVFTDLKEEKKIERKEINGDIILDNRKIFEILVKWIDKRGKYYVDGNKHKFLVSLAGACNRCGMPETDCLQLLWNEFKDKASPVDERDYRDIVHRVYNNYSHQYATFKLSTDDRILSRDGDVEINDDEILGMTLELKDVIFLDNVKDSMIRTFYSGLSLGETTYFPEIDEVYRMKRGELTLFHGMSNHGKTTMLMQLCLIKAAKDGYRFAVFSPEQDPPDDFYDDLIHAYIGRSTQKQSYDQMSIEEYRRGMDFIKDHFYYIYPENESPTPEYINARFKELIEKRKVDGCIIDPYNQLDNDLKKESGREDQYLSRFLTKQKRFAQDNKIFMWIITHPRGDIKKNKEGNYDIPDVYDLAGGAMWNHKCDNVICVYRPYFSTDRTNPVTWLISQKIKKQKLCGRPGQVTMTFDWVAQRYHIMANSKFHPLNDMEEKKENDNKDMYDFTKSEKAPF